MKGDDGIRLVKKVGHETSKVLGLAGIENKIMVPSGQSLYSCYLTEYNLYGDVFCRQRVKKSR